MMRLKDSVKYLIVNADDLGASRGINRAIFELHERGIVTSTSLMIRLPAAAEAVTGIDSRSADTAPGCRPAARSAASTARTVASVAPKRGPN